MKKVYPCDKCDQQGICKDRTRCCDFCRYMGADNRCEHCKKEDDGHAD